MSCVSIVSNCKRNSKVSATPALQSPSPAQFHLASISSQQCDNSSIDDTPYNLSFDSTELQNIEKEALRQIRRHGQVGVNLQMRKNKQSGE